MLSNPKNGIDAVFNWLDDCETFTCNSYLFCNNECKQPVADKPIVFVRTNGSATCLTNSPDKQYPDPVICQFVI